MVYKKGVNFFVIGILFFIFAYYVAGDLDVANNGREDSYTHLNVSNNVINGRDFDVLIKNGTNYIFNFTIVIDNAIYNLTSFNITVPYNLTIADWGTDSAINANIFFMNASHYDNWTLFNYTADGWNDTLGFKVKESRNINGAYNVFIHHNNTYWRNSSDAFISGGMNYSVNSSAGYVGYHASNFTFWFNATPNISVVNNNYDVVLQFKFVADLNDSTARSGKNTTYFNVTVDPGAPRIWGVNVSDGNTTWTQAYLNGSYHLSSKSSLTIEAMVNDSRLNTTVGSNIAMYYYTNSTSKEIGNVTMEGITHNETKRFFRVNATITGSSSPYKLNFSIPASRLSGGGKNSNATTFIIIANDTLEQQGNSSGGILNDMFADFIVPFFTINATSDVLRFGEMNITDGNSQTDVRDEYAMRNKTFVGALRNLHINLTLEGRGRNSTTGISNSSTQVRLYYNTSRSANETDAFIVMTNLTNIPSDYGDTNEVIYNTTFNSSAFSDGTVVHLLAVANDSTSYKTYTLQHNFTVDGSNPIATVSKSASSITAGSSITISCSATDADPTLTYRVYYSYSGSENWVGGSSYAFSPTDTGTYTIKCDAKDTTDHTGTSSESTFTVTSSTSGNNVAGGSAGGTTSGATVTAHRDQEIELGTITTKSAYMYEGSSATFTISTGASHSVRIDDVDLVNKKVKVTIMSDPITVELGIGEEKQVDVNNDGTNDVKVRLNDIDLNLARADVTITDLTLEAGEEVPSGEVTPEEEKEPEAKPIGMSWIWWVIIIIVIIVIIALILPKKK